VQKMLKAPFVIYADLESYTTKLYGPLNKDARTHNYELHEPSGFAYQVVCSESSIHSFEPVVYRGENVIQELLTRLREEYARIHAILKDVKPMKLTEEEKASFKAAQVCYLCRKPVDTLEKVRDHCHLTGSVQRLRSSELQPSVPVLGRQEKRRLLRTCDLPQSPRL
jgi:hypothetical protein